MSMIPADYPPPVHAGEFVAQDQLPAERQISVGVLFVGAGPASLAGAIRLSQLLEAVPSIKARFGDFPIAVIEKGRYPGAHLLSGAVINPSPFRQLFPGRAMHEFPFAKAVPGEAVYFLTARRALRIPVPPTMRNHGHYVASLSRVGAWLGRQAEALGVTILNETAGVKVLVGEGRVCGVRTGDKGRDRQGQPLPNFDPGVDLRAHFTVFGEGGAGHLTQAVLEHFQVQRPHPQIYALGVKEVWEVPQPLPHVVHTMGWPLRLSARFREFGGSFAYPLGENKISLGLVVGLDYADASLSIHDLFQEMKTHPFFFRMLRGGKRAERGWGAKTIPEGGFYSLPERLQVPGACIVGDAAGLVNVPALKGIHYAMWSGIYAAEAIFQALAADAPEMIDYDGRMRASFIHRELYQVRNMRQAFHHGFVVGGALAGLMTLTGGRLPGRRMQTAPDSAQPMRDTQGAYAKPDGVTTFDKLSSVHAAGNRSRDDQPNHLRVATNVPAVIGKTLVNLCPAAVYEWTAATPDAPGHLRINPTNCVHCGAISAKGGRLTPQEGGSGPEYTEM